MTKKLLWTVLAACLVFLMPGLAPAATGGPDSFGYTYIDSNEPGGPAFAWEDISGTGASVGLSDDVVSGFVPVGFPFNFYGLDYTQLRISSNGFLTFDDDGNSFCCGGGSIPAVDGNENMIAALWDDLVPSSARYQTLGSAPSRRFIVQFDNVPKYARGGSNSFQYVLFENTNEIQVNYLNVQTQNGWAGQTSVGIENADGTIGLRYTPFDTPGNFSNVSVLYSPFTCTDQARLSTVFASNNSFQGNMLDLTNVSAAPIELTGYFESNLETGATGTMEVWYRPGTFVGHESDVTGWTLLGTAAVTSNGSNTPTGYNIGNVLEVPPGETVGLFFYFNGTFGATLYTNDADVFTDGTIQITTGIGKGNSLDTPPVTGAVFTPRTWNGTIEYSSVGTGANVIVLDNAAAGPEDTQIELHIAVNPACADDLNVSSITIDGVPAGATLSAGIDNGDGSWTLSEAQLAGLTITPPPNSNADFTLTVTVSGTSIPDGTAVIRRGIIMVTLTGVADTPTLTADNAYPYYAGPMSIAASLTDLDGSETLSISITGVPFGATFNHGVNNGNGTWTFFPGDLADLKITLPPPASFQIAYDLTVIATVQEDDGDTTTLVRNLKIVDLTQLIDHGGVDTDSGGGGGGGCTLGDGRGSDLLLPALILAALVGLVARRRLS